MEQFETLTDEDVSMLEAAYSVSGYDKMPQDSIEFILWNDAYCELMMRGVNK